MATSGVCFLRAGLSSGQDTRKRRRVQQRHNRMSRRRGEQVVAYQASAPAGALAKPGDMGEGRVNLWNFRGEDRRPTHMCMIAKLSNGVKEVPCA